MSRETACFSMYSLMSSRTMFSSLSNIDSASARASSVLPTPVGPRKMNEPMGRFGSLSPARARMTASATACTASSWPMTRSCKMESSRSSFSCSPSSSRATGTPVQRATTSAISSAVTSSCTRRGPPLPSFADLAIFSSASFSAFSFCGRTP